MHADSPTTPRWRTTRVSHRLSRIRRLALLTLVAILAACGSSSSSGPASSAEEVSFTLNYLNDWYLWRDQLANANVADYSSAESALAALKVAEDRYSYISQAQAYNAFFAGNTIGFGLNFRIENNSIRVYAVQPSAPAATAGLRRGDLITSIDGKTTTDIIADNSLAAAFGPSEAGVSRAFGIIRDATPLTINIVKAQYPLTYVLAQSLLSAGTRQVGYVNFYSFAEPGIVPWQNALDSLLEQGAQDLIVDLRFNGGGLMSTAARIGAALGDANLGGKVMSRLLFNNQHGSSDRQFTFGSDARAGRFDRVVWITSRHTCSASEAMLLGVNAWRSGALIGETTCGKPVGFTPPTFGDKVYSIVSFRIENSQGVSNYYSGLTPDCAVNDSGLGVLGDANEAMIAAALQYLSNGQCPASAQAPKHLPQPSGQSNQAPWRVDFR